jgi:hypothetical protein
MPAVMAGTANLPNLPIFAAVFTASQGLNL